MESVVLRNKSESGASLEASFLPQKGMNLSSFKKGSIEVIDPSTQTAFKERFGGLGPLIGPHFHQRRPQVIPSIDDESLFPHIAKIKEHGGKDPFSHGIGRYAPWKVIETTATSIHATLSGRDPWQGISLAQLEGQDFNMTFTAELTPKGLQLVLSVVSDTDSIIGIHYYYHLPQGKGKVISNIQNSFLDLSNSLPIPSNWDYSDQHTLTFDLDNHADYTFHPHPNPRGGSVLLDAGAYQLRTSYMCASEENSWQLYHPKGASFVCIEPLSAQDPRHPNLSVSSIKIELEIL